MRFVALLVAAIALSLSLSSVVVASNGGVLEGRLVNGTEGGSSVADQDVILTTYLNDAEVGSTTTKTDADGRFRFDGLSIEPTYRYEVSLWYQGAEYTSESLSFEEAESTRSIDLVVYDSTTSDETITISLSHTIVYVEEASLLVKQYLLIGNNGDRTYIGSGEIASDGEKETLRFSLPKGAIDLQFTRGLMECCAVMTDGGLSDTIPVLPGAREIAYSYRVEYDSGTYTLSQALDYPTARVDFLVKGEGIDVTSEQLTSEEAVNIEDARFLHLSGANLAPGSVLRINFLGPSKANGQSALKWTALVLIVLVGGFGLGYPLARRRLRPAISEEGLNERRQRLLFDIAQLDDEFEDGKIPEEVYRRRRAEWKAQLAEIMSRPNEDA